MRRRVGRMFAVCHFGLTVLLMPGLQQCNIDEQWLCEDTAAGFRRINTWGDTGINEHEYTFDGKDRLTKYVYRYKYRIDSGWQEAEPAVSEVWYDAKGRVRTLRRGDGTFEVTYDDLNRIIGIVVKTNAREECMTRKWPCLPDGTLLTEVSIEYTTDNLISHIVKRTYERGGDCDVRLGNCTEDGFIVRRYIAPGVDESGLSIKVTEPFLDVERLTLPDDEICWLNWVNHVKQPVESCGDRVFGNFTELGDLLEEVGRPTCATFGR